MSAEIRKIVEETYRKVIKEGPYPDDFKRSLKTHERIPRFFDNLVRELSKPLLNLKRETIELAATDMTRVFVRACFAKAEERVMSPVKKAMLKARQSRIAEMKKLGDALVAQGDANEQIKKTAKGETSYSQVKIGENDVARPTRGRLDTPERI